MSGNDGSGCGGTILAGVLLALVLAVSVAVTGLPTWDGSLGWDTTATAERQQTERERIAAENETERQRIISNERTSAEWAVTWRILGVAAAMAGGVYAWSRRPHRPQPAPAPVVNLLAHYPGHVAELIDGEWCIVEPMTGGYYTAQDAVRLLTMQNEF